MRTNEENIELLAITMEAVTEIITDPDVLTVIKSGGAPIKTVTLALKGHKTACVNLLASLEGEYPEDYKVPPPGVLLVKMVKLFNDPSFKSLFTMQGLNEVAASSGSATENIEDNEKDGV